jgi:hypothetical protein
MKKTLKTMMKMTMEVAEQGKAKTTRTKMKRTQVW